MVRTRPPTLTQRSGHVVITSVVFICSSPEMARIMSGQATSLLQDTSQALPGASPGLTAKLVYLARNRLT
jgi:hypothetical protein